MSTTKKHPLSFSNRQLFFGAIITFILVLGGVGILYTTDTKLQSIQTETEELIQSQELELQEAKELAQKVKEEADKKKAAEQQAITDAEEAAKSAQETQSAEDKAANRYSNVYGAEKVREATCGAYISSGAPRSLIASYSRDDMINRRPFTVTISTPDGGPLGQVNVQAASPFTASPKQFTSDKSSASFSAQYNSDAGFMGPSMDTQLGYMLVSSSCGARYFSATINVTGN
jgi:multidrug efflux pump subunit AcrA (membrane-fusion protein)